MEKPWIILLCFLSPLIIFIASWLLLIIPLSIKYNYQWKSTIYQYWELSDRASTADKKLEQLLLFREALVKNGLNEGQARYVFKTKATDLSENMAILDSLIERLNTLIFLDKSSLEYQQALRQITVDEYQGFNNCVFADGWRRKSIFRYLYSYATCQKGNYAGVSDE